MKFVKNSNAALFLFINAFLWGSSYVWSKMLLGYLPRFSILFLCSLGGLVSTLVFFFPEIKKVNIKTIKNGIVISSFSIISNTFFIFALQYTSSSNTAFIVQMSVVFTPLLMSAVERKRPGAGIITSVLIAVAGLFLLTCDIRNLSFKPGDLLALGNALFFSLFLTSQKCNSEKLNPIQFTFVHHAANSAFFLVAALLFETDKIKPEAMLNPIFLLLISASIFITVFTILMQSSAIKYVRPEKATIIYTFEPVAALILAGIFNGERLEGANAAAGCILILLSILYSAYRPLYKERKSSNIPPETAIREV